MKKRRIQWKIILKDVLRVFVLLFFIALIFGILVVIFEYSLFKISGGENFKGIKSVPSFHMKIYEYIGEVVWVLVLLYSFYKSALSDVPNKLAHIILVGGIVWGISTLNVFWGDVGFLWSLYNFFSVFGPVLFIYYFLTRKNPEKHLSKK